MDSKMKDLSSCVETNMNVLFNSKNQIEEAMNKLELISSQLKNPNLDLTQEECRVVKLVLENSSTKLNLKMEGVKELNKQLDLMWKVVQPSLTWLKTEGSTPMEFIRGKSPWSIQLQHVPYRLKEIEATFKKLKSGLKSVPNPQVGDVVCVMEHPNFLFRGIILKFMAKNRVNILNFDKDLVKCVKLQQLYALPSELLDIPAQVVHCSLLPEDPETEQLWNNEIQEYFCGLITECNLSIELIEELSECEPKKFLVQAIGQTGGEVAHFNYWLSEKLIPEMYAKRDKNKKVLVNLLEEFHPFEPIKSQILPNTELSEEELSFDGFQLTEPQYTDQNNSVAKVETQVASMFTEVPSANAAVIYPEMTEEDEMNIISNLGDEYQPTDESRYCYLYLKNKKCWKTNCSKLHKMPSGRWTDDQVLVYVNLYNKINLPLVHQEVSVSVMSVISGCAFYVALHPYYSDIGEDHCKLETIDDLHFDLNDPANVKDYKYLQMDPSIGELVIVKDRFNKFRRGRIIGSSETKFTVFLIDFGFEEEVGIMEMRHILPQFLHLPAQVVFTTLDQVKVNDQKLDESKNCLKSMIEGKMLTAKVIEREVLESFLSVELYTKDRVCLNKVMVEKGFCVKL